MWIQQSSEAKRGGGKRGIGIIEDAFVDSGQLMIASCKAMRSYDDQAHVDRLSIEGSALVLNNGDRLQSGGVDFFDWDKVLPAYGKSPNQLVKSGLAKVVEPKGCRLGSMTYEGACSASNRAGGFGYIGRDAIEEAVVFHVRNDGPYSMFRMEAAHKVYEGEASSFGLVPFREAPVGDEKVWLVPIGRFRSHGQIAMCDPCAPNGTEIQVLSDADGDTEVFGYYVPGQFGLSGFALPLA